MQDIQPTHLRTFVVEKGPDHRIVVLSGELEFETAPYVRQTLTEAVAKAARVEVDLGKVSFLDSTGINALVAARKAARASGCAFVVINPSARVRRMLAITGLLDVLMAEDDQPAGATGADASDAAPGG